MLCAKNLKVALAAILGVVGLMGAGTAHAAIKLVPEDATAAARTTGHAPQYFAAERLAGDSTSTSTLVMVSATSSGFNVDVPAITAGLEANTTYYLRFDLLDGGGFAGGKNSPSSGGTPIAIGFSDALLSGSQPQLFSTAGGNTAIDSGTLLRVLGRNEATIYSISVPATAIPRNEGRMAWVIPDATGFEVGLGSPSEEKTYYLRLSIWDSRGDAEGADFGDLGSQDPLWAAANTIVMTKRTLTTAVQDAREITATVASDFRRFMPENENLDGPTGATTAEIGKLVTATVTFEDSVRVGTTPHEIRDHRDGNQIVLTEVLTEVNVGVTGSVGTDSYNFGDFFLDPYDAGCSARPMTRGAAMGSMVAATATTTASLSNVLAGATVAAELAEITAGPDTGKKRAQFVFCANVTENTEDQMPMEFERINEVVYMMELNTELVGHTDTQYMTNGMGGEIVRDGTEVRIAYLTTATAFGGTRTWQDGAIGAYNQRLVIVNHGSSAVGYQLGQFASETMRGGAAVAITVEAQAGASLSGMLAPRSSTVMRVQDLIQIMEGGEAVAGRTAAVLTLVGAPDDISVATTQVTLPEGQTDTVRYHPLTER